MKIGNFKKTIRYSYFRKFHEYNFPPHCWDSFTISYSVYFKNKNKKTMRVEYSALMYSDHFHVSRREEIVEFKSKNFRKDLGDNYIKKT